MADWNHPSPKIGFPGDPKCPLCGATGVIEVPGSWPPAVRVCRCMHKKEIMANVENGWPGLLKAKRLGKGKSSRLADHVSTNLWVTSSLTWFKAHLRWIAVRKPPTWDFSVVSDVDLMRAWLGSVPLSGREIIDPDAASVSMRHLTLLDLIEPPGLLVIRVGVKTARNAATPEVLLETLYHRMHLGKATWVYNDHANPLDDTMRAYCEEVGEVLSDWERIVRGSLTPKVRETPEVLEEDDDDDLEDITPGGSSGGPAQARAKRRTISSGSGAAKATKQPVKIDPKKKPYKPGGKR